MSAIPIYHKTDENAPRPTDPIFYWFTRSGLFLCRNHSLFQSDVPVDQMPRSLKEHRTACVLDYPLFPAAALEFIIGFFDRIYLLHGSEAIVLLFWDQQRGRGKLCVPPQTATVSENRYGERFPLDVKYEVPAEMLQRYQLLGDIHSHGDHTAYSSYQDRLDEKYRDGAHIIVGEITREPPSFSANFSADGHPFTMPVERVFRGYRCRRRIVPQQWIKQVQVDVIRPKLTSYESVATYDTTQHNGNRRLPGPNGDQA